MLLRRHGEFARVLLVSRAGRFRISRVFEEIASRRDLLSNTGVVELVWRLYFNPKRGTVRPGVAATDRPGTISRFAQVLQQLSLNYDLPGMTAQEIGDLLPREFDSWRRRANWDVTDARRNPRAPLAGRRVLFDGIAVGSTWRRAQLAELWGYRGTETLKQPLLAPRGFASLILFVGPDDPWEIEVVEEAPDPRTVRWTGDARRTVDRRLIAAIREERTVHVFRRPKESRTFTYLGPCRVLAHLPRTDGPSQFVLRLPPVGA
jgi:hypothetical protein